MITLGSYLETVHGVLELRERGLIYGVKDGQEDNFCFEIMAQMLREINYKGQTCYYLLDIDKLDQIEQYTYETIEELKPLVSGLHDKKEFEKRLNQAKRIGPKKRDHLKIVR